MQHNATHWQYTDNTLQYTDSDDAEDVDNENENDATHCNTLQHTAIHCNTQMVTMPIMTMKMAQVRTMAMLQLMGSRHN